MSDRNRFWLKGTGALAVAALTVLGMQACGGNSGGSGGTGGHHSSSSSGVGGSLFDPDGGASGSGGSSGDGMIDPDAACAAESIEAVLVPVNMWIVFDRSASMAYKSKFSQATDALNAFFTDPNSAGLRVALRFFPFYQDCDSTMCDVNQCATPTVPLGTLVAAKAPTDKQEDALVNVVNMTQPAMTEQYAGGSPIIPALQGAAQWGTTYIAAHPKEKAVIVLVTDGEPNGCDTNYQTLNDTAASAHAKGVDTYVVGLKTFFETQMNAVAAAGGTGQAFFIGQANAEQDLLSALQSIQKIQVSCALPMPQSQGKPADPTKVNVNYTTGGGMPTVVKEVDNAQACANGDGWYYDDPINPKTITLCPTTCATVQSDATAKLDVLLGCASVLN